MEMIFKLNKANLTQGYDLSLLFNSFIKSSRDLGAGFYFPVTQNRKVSIL